MSPPIKCPVRALRDWEGYVPLSEYEPEDHAEMLARAFTRILDADNQTIVNAHDCFEFKPGHAERIVACLNACAHIPTEQLVGSGIAAVFSAAQTQSAELAAHLRFAVEWAARAADHWDADQDAKVGKMLLALAGRIPGYDARVTALHEALAKVRS